MSRSYKKTPYSGDSKGKIKKRIANHKIRQKLKKIDFECQHMAYKNVGIDRYDMCDFYWIEPWENFWFRENRFYQEGINSIHKSYALDENDIKKPDKKESYRTWYKIYKMK